jgi:hypothetical protein
MQVEGGGCSCASCGRHAGRIAAGVYGWRFDGEPDVLVDGGSKVVHSCLHEVGL